MNYRSIVGHIFGTAQVAGPHFLVYDIHAIYNSKNAYFRPKLSVHFFSLGYVYLGGSWSLSGEERQKEWVQQCPCRCFATVLIGAWQHFVAQKMPDCPAGKLM